MTYAIFGSAFIWMIQPIFYFKQLSCPYFVHYMSLVINFYACDLGILSAKEHFKQGNMWTENFELGSSLGWRRMFIGEVAVTHVSCFLCKKKSCV